MLKVWLFHHKAVPNKKPGEGQTSPGFYCHLIYWPASRQSDSRLPTPHSRSIFHNAHNEQQVTTGYLLSVGRIDVLDAVALVGRVKLGAAAIVLAQGYLAEHLHGFHQCKGFVDADDVALLHEVRVRRR